MVGTTKFEARIKELVEKLPDITVLVEPLLIVRRVLREQIDILHRRLLARDDEVSRRLMTVLGVGPVVALTYRVTVERAGPFQELQGGRRGVRTDAHQVSIARERPNWSDITVRRRDDADALGPPYSIQLIMKRLSTCQAISIRPT
jgi:hypothetical protein